jgi:hypothetical protein
VVEDVKVRSLVVMQRSQTEEYLATQENIGKMKAKKFVLTKQFGPNFATFSNVNLSFYTRYTTMDLSSFGDHREEEPNLAYSILVSIKKVSLSVSEIHAAVC